MTAIHSYFQKLLCIAALIALAALPAAAQSAANGTITGTVTDKTGAAIPNATVVITDTDTGAVHNVTTSGEGSFYVPFLQSGHYEVTAAVANFTTLDHKNLTLTVGEVLTVDSPLPAASTSTEIVVTTEAPLLDTQKVEQSQTVTQAYVANLPINARNWSNFVLLTPNVAPDSSSGLVSYRGISGLYNNNLVDGVSNEQALFAEARGRATGAPYVFPSDAIKEFESSVSGYSAEFGSAAGGVVNAITKSGTNQIHGDLYYMLRYPTLNALDPYSKWSALHNGGPAALLTQTVHQQQQFGGSVGGPIIKDKLFYFFTYDGYRRVNPILYSSITSLATLTTWANTPGTGTPAGVTLYAGTTGFCPTGAGPGLTPLTTAQCVAAANFLAAQEGTFPRVLKQDIFFPKLDYQLDEKDHIATSFLWQDFHEPNGYNTAQTVTSSSGVQANGTANFHQRYYIASWDRVLNNTTANALKFQWSRDLETDSANAPGPAVSLTSVAAYGESIAIPREAEPDEHRWEIFDVISQTRGKHTFKAGVDLNFIHEIMINLFQGDGTYGYTGSSGAAFTNWVQDVYNVNGGQHYATFTQVVDPITGLGKDDFWNKNLSAFVEDSWKILPNLTINAGVRYDVQLVPQPPSPLMFSGNGAPDPFGTALTSKIHINYKMFQPRIGFAWNPYPGTVVRGGYGLFYGLVPLSAYYNVRVENGVFQKQYNLNPTTGVGTITYPDASLVGMDVLFPPPGAPLAAPFTGAHMPTATGLPAANAALSPHGMDPNYTQPYSHSWDLAVEQQLTPTTSLTLSYVGTRGMRLPYSIDANQPAYTGATKTYDVVNTAGVTQSTVTVPFYPAGLTKPSPNDGNFSVAYSGLNSWYNAGTVSITQKMKYGFQALVNYTWAHTTDAGQTSGGGNGVNTGGGTFFGTDPILDPFNRKGIYANPNINMTREQARSDLDMRERFVASIIYTSKTHFGKYYANYAASGWTIAGTATENTGFPYTAITSNAGPPSGVYTPNGGGTATAAGFDGGATGAADNTNNSGSGTVARAPQVPRNGFSGPGIHNIDMRVSRDFDLTHGMRFQVLVEAFNALNHRNGLGVAQAGFTFVAPGGAASCPTGTHTNTCIAPNVTTPAFGQINSTSGSLYGARQMQFAAKLFF